MRASGDSGMLPADLRRLGECMFLATECSLFLRPCSDEGRDGSATATLRPLAGLLGVVLDAELDAELLDSGDSDGLVADDLPPTT